MRSASGKTARAGRPKLGLVPISDGDGQIVERLLSSIRPSPENDKLYRPVSGADPEIVALAESIRKKGLLEPIVITLDDYIISGHRRYAACSLADLTRVRCRRINVRHTDTEEFLALLREHNRQREKSLDEIAREEIVSANPEEAHRFLVEHRQKKSQVTTETIPIRGSQKRSQISKAKAPMLRAIQEILRDRRNFWPLTDRQIHYALLNNPPLTHASKPDSRYQNKHSCYKMTCDLVTRARLTGQIPFMAIADPTRPMNIGDFHRGVASFVKREMDGFLKYYYRDLQQSQPNHIEIIGEKNTIHGTIEPIASQYGIPLTIGRGYCSIPLRYQMAQRFKASGKEKLILLAMSDFDPEGEDIAHSFARSMRDDFGINNIVPTKVALTEKQVRELGLPPSCEAKKSSSRCKAFTEAHGNNVFELEAVQPGQLQRMLRDAIDAVLDIDAFNAEIDAEKRDAAKLTSMRRKVHEQLAGINLGPDSPAAA